MYLKTNKKLSVDGPNAVRYGMPTEGESVMQDKVLYENECRLIMDGGWKVDKKGAP